MQHDHSDSLSRRDFVKTTGGVAAAVAAGTVLGTRSAAAQNARGKKELKIGLVGCGGRGSGAVKDAMKADPDVKITALCDIFEDRLNGLRNAGELKERHPIADDHCFLGFDGYKKLLETDVDYVILATPPYYRPIHFPACIAAGKHVFMEKPVAVDPVGIRKMLVAGEAADKKNLCVAAGTQRRHEAGYIETIKRIHDGAIGDIVSGQCYWNMGQLWFRKREAGWSEMDWMHRDWVNWAWLSGDHIVEQHVHNLDVINWVIGTHPIKVVAMGGRQRRVTGDQYDFFDADFEYPNHVHIHSQCRQISGCADNVSERVIGTKGVSNCNGWISSMSTFKGAKGLNPYVQEHKDLIDAIRSGSHLNETRNVAESTMCAIMIRTSAYTGQEVVWDDIMKSDLELSPPNYELTDANIRAHIPVPGKA